MRSTRRLSLLITVAVTAMALATTESLANSGVEALDEVTGGHCSQVFLDGDHTVTGGCAIHVTGTVSLFLHTGATELNFSACGYEYDMRINESASGWIHNQALTGAACGIQVCDEAAPEHTNVAWPVQVREVSGAMTLRTTLCLRGTANTIEGATGSLCTVDLAVTDFGDHAYSLSAAEAPCLNDPQYEVTGIWTMEDTGAEVAHL